MVGKMTPGKSGGCRYSHVLPGTAHGVSNRHKICTDSRYDTYLGGQGLALVAIGAKIRNKESTEGSCSTIRCSTPSPAPLKRDARRTCRSRNIWSLVAATRCDMRMQQSASWPQSASLRKSTRPRTHALAAFF